MAQLHSNNASGLDPALIAHELGARAPLFGIDVLASCTSSNTVLVERAAAGAAHRSVVVCAELTAGRGRRGRSWLAPPGASLAFSLLWRFPPGASAPLGLSLAVGAAVARAAEQQGATHISLKWPNDVLYDGRKLAGILIELVAGVTAAPAAVIGIGINLHLPDGLAAEAGFEAADLAAASGRPPAAAPFLARLLIQLDDTLTRFTDQGFAGLREEWLTRCAHLEAPVRLDADYGPAITGCCVGVDDDGALLVATEGGLKRILGGDVSLRPA